MKGFTIFLFALLLGVVVGYETGFGVGRHSVNEAPSLDRPRPPNRGLTGAEKACWWLAPDVVKRLVDAHRIVLNLDEWDISAMDQLKTSSNTCVLLDPAYTGFPLAPDVLTLLELHCQNCAIATVQKALEGYR